MCNHARDLARPATKCDSTTPQGRLSIVWARRFRSRIGGSPYLLYGTIDALRDGMLRRREGLGISSYGIPAAMFEALAPLVESLAGR